MKAKKLQGQPKALETSSTDHDFLKKRMFPVGELFEVTMLKTVIKVVRSGGGGVEHLPCIEIGYRPWIRVGSSTYVLTRGIVQ